MSRYVLILAVVTVLISTDLKMAHEQQRKSLEEEFEKLRLSLQVKVHHSTRQVVVRKSMLL